MTVQQLIDMVHAYVRQACEPLKVDSHSICVDVVNNVGVKAPKGINYNSNKGCLDVDSGYLKVANRLRKPTTIRRDTYYAVYMWYIDSKGINCIDADLDAYAYSFLLCNMLGLHLQDVDMPDVDSIRVRNRATELLKDIFHIDGKFCEATFSDGYKTIRQKTIVMSSASYDTYKKSMTRPTDDVHVLSVSEGQPGSIDNPFYNIDKACDYVKQEEEKAYKEDEFLHNRIEKQSYFYDGHQFRLEWANPFVAHKINKFAQNSFIVNQVERPGSNYLWYSLKPNLYKRKFLFRGQSQYYSPCKPNLFRTDKTNYVEDLIWGNEMTLVVRSHPLVKLFEHGIDLLHDIFHFSVNYYGLQQHYYNKTSMLDLTSDIEAARFFAVTDYNAAKDEYSVHKNDGKLGVFYYYEIKLPGAFGIQSNGVHLSIIGKQPFMRSGQQHGFLLHMPKDADFNTLPHVNKVFFRHDDTVSQRIFEESKQGKVFFPSDLLEHHWKKYNAIYKDKKMVSLDAIKENHKHNKNVSLSEIERQLKNRGYSYNRHLHPAFDPDELNSYYKDMRNGLWEEFCNDIYFYGPENDLYRELLLQAENNPKYRKYFFGE